MSVLCFQYFEDYYTNTVLYKLCKSKLNKVNFELVYTNNLVYF